MPDQTAIQALDRHQRALLEIEGIPGQAENFALAKTEDQNQYVGGV